MDRKTFGADAVKLSDRGEIEAAFAQLNVVDLDGDLTLPGAFPAGKEVPLSAYGHTSWLGEPPVGKGSISEEGNWAVFRGSFFLQTNAGRDTYETIKAMGPLQEYSYGYEPTDVAYQQQDGKTVRLLKRLEVFEVSPVLRGAGIGTHTRGIKALKAAIAPHGTDTYDGAWNAAEMEARLPSERSALRAAHAWVDDQGDPDAKSSYRFIHHTVSPAGDPGAANITACFNGIAVLNGARGGTTIPGSDRAGVWRHLARHLRDADREPPELNEGLDAGLKLADAVDWFLDDAEALARRYRSMADLRAKEGRVLSEANRNRLAAIRDAITQILDETDPAKATAAHARQIEVLLEEARFLGVPI